MADVKRVVYEILAAEGSATRDVCAAADISFGRLQDGYDGRRPAVVLFRSGGGLDEGGVDAAVLGARCYGGTGFDVGCDVVADAVIADLHGAFSVGVDGGRLVGGWSTSRSDGWDQDLAPAAPYVLLLFEASV